LRLAAGSPHIRNKRPGRVDTFKPGDLVRTPLARIARIVASRADGYVDAEYVDQTLHSMLSATRSPIAVQASQ
jgi:hypothetical protein